MRVTLVLLGVFCLIVLSHCEILDDLKESCLNDHGKPLHVSILTIPTRGHVNPMIGLGQYLARLGCRVTFPIVESKLDWIKFEGIEAIPIPLGDSVDEIPLENRRELSKQSEVNVAVQWAKMMFSAQNKNSPMRQFLEMMEVPFAFLRQKYLAGEYSPDIAITEKVIFLFVDLAKSMNATVISINPSLLAKSPEITNKQHYIPSFGTNAPLEMSYVQRVMNYFLYPMIENFMITMYLPLFYEVCEKYGLDSSAGFFRLYNGVEIIQTFFGLEYPVPVLPNQHLVGPMLPLELKKIPEGIAAWLDENANKPIVYFCLGTVVSIPPEAAEILMQAFADQPYQVLWSLPKNQQDILENMPPLPSNVRLESFVPQRELLLDPRIRVFLSHAGASSTNEAVTSATPVLCMPFFSDQFDYCSRLVHTGMAERLDRLNLTIPDIRAKVDRLLSDESYQQQATRLKKLARTDGTKRAAEIILNAHHIGSSHLTIHAANLPWYQRTALDLRITLFVFQFSLPFILYILYKLFFLCCCCCRKKQSVAKKNATNKEKAD